MLNSGIKCSQTSTGFPKYFVPLLVFEKLSKWFQNRQKLSKLVKRSNGLKICQENTSGARCSSEVLGNIPSVMSKHLGRRINLHFTYFVAIFFAWLHLWNIEELLLNAGCGWVGAFPAVSAGWLYRGADDPAHVDWAAPPGHIQSWVLTVAQAPVQNSQRDIQDVLFKLESKQAIYWGWFHKQTQA